MGLGKTLMTLALLAANPPPRGEKNRATLIVCPPGLLLQCKFENTGSQLRLVLLGSGEREIEKHTEAGHLDAVLKHHSADRVSGKAAVRVMQEQDIM